MKKYIFFGFLFCFLAPISTVFAQQQQPCNDQLGCLEVGVPGSDITKGQGVLDVATSKGFVGFLGSVGQAIVAIVVAMGIIIVVVGGYLYMTAGGDQGKVKTAKAYIGSALLGIALALAAFVLLSRISPQFTQPKEPTLNIQ